jgi:pimeloyl-ACP methyl ester carboxylesterase
MHRMAQLILRVIFLFVLWLIDVPRADAPQIWSVIAIDAKGDARDATLGDVAQLAYRYDKTLDTLWFRIGLYGQPAATAVSVKIATGDRHVTATGTRDGSAIVVGITRTDLTDKTTFDVVVAVGANEQWHDSIPDAGPPATVDVSAARPVRGLREIDSTRNNLRFEANVKTLGDDRPPRIAVRAGRGRRDLILIPGVYSGDAVFDRFVARNASRYRFHMVTPPGLGGTPPRQLPPETSSAGEFRWTRRLARDIRELIERNRLDKPIVVVHGFPGSLAAEELTSTHPQLLGGVIEVASMPVQAMASFANPGRELTPAERIAIVDISWVQQWFKYVTPETWESNNYQAAMLANDAEYAERARRELERPPLAVKIRYLVEYMASDHREMLATMAVPVLLLLPGFNDAVLADPAHSWFKTRFMEGWTGLPANPHRHVVTIADARVLLLDDQPEQADGAIAAFVISRGHPDR